MLVGRSGSGQEPDFIQPALLAATFGLKLKNGVQVTLNNSRVSPLTIRNYRLVKKEEVIFANTATLEVETLKTLVIDPFFELIKVQIAKEDALALEVNHFIQCLLGKAKLAITAREATNALINIENMIEKLSKQNGMLLGKV